MTEICIVDDDKEFIDYMEKCIKRYSRENEVPCRITSFSNPYLFLDSYDGQFDVIFMDIQMEGMSGLTVIKKLHESNSAVVLVFCSSYMKYAVDGYEVNAFDFMVKPFDYNSFALKFMRVLKMVKRQKNNAIVIKGKEKTVKITVDSVFYIEVFAHYLTYHTEDGIIEARGSIEEQEIKLRCFQFCRVNRFTLVNLKKVDCLQENNISINGDTLKISRLYKKKVMDEFNNLWRG